MYYGLGVYRMLDATKPPWNSPNEILWQIRDVRRTKTPGFVFYSTSNFDKLHNGIADSIARYNMNYAFPPVMRWLDSIAPAAPVAAIEQTVKGTLLTWNGENPKQEPLKFAVYRFDPGEAVNLNKSEHIIALVQETQYLDIEPGKHLKSKYVITALDRLWNESNPSNMVSLSAE